jgi:hypothetical protein
MSIIVKNSQLNSETIDALNNLIELDINATAAFRLTRIIKEVSSIVEDKLATEKRILEKWVEKDENDQVVRPKDQEGNFVEDAVNITNVQEFTKEMNELMLVESEIKFDKIKFEDLNLQTAKVKDLIKLDFLFD